MIEQFIQQQNELLRELIDTLKPSSSQPVGFGDSVKPRYVYVNRSQKGFLWYWLNDAREVVPITQVSLTGRIVKLEFKQVERRGSDTWKLHLHIQADRLYILEAGYEVVFSKSVIATIAKMTQPQLKGLVTLEVRAAESDEVVFVSIYSNGELILAPHDEISSWKETSKLAIANINQATS